MYTTTYKSYKNCTTTPQYNQQCWKWCIPVNSFDIKSTSLRTVTNHYLMARPSLL